MTALILDASVAAAWLLDDGREPRADAALALIEESGGLVPPLWHLEVRNVLLTAERRGRIAADRVHDRLAGLAELPIQTAAEPDLDQVLALARTHRLSVYDAVYLALARRHDAPLATLDAALAGAAEAADVPSV
ncbi:MAG: type II toxin-antitoxin system VapC family toxin [Chloroflexi bacterium]|nr:type II toxin-antitoxin system VapC family toxin [Chloroflexota bacterium]